MTTVVGVKQFRSAEKSTKEPRVTLLLLAHLEQKEKFDLTIEKKNQLHMTLMIWRRKQLRNEI